jgi:hypothetical protein
MPRPTKIASNTSGTSHKLNSTLFGPKPLSINSSRALPNAGSVTAVPAMAKNDRIARLRYGLMIASKRRTMSLFSIWFFRFQAHAHRCSITLKLGKPGRWAVIV